MLINKLTFTQKKALARELRKLIEPEKAKTSRILKENVLRRFMAEKGIIINGISDVISILRANYSSKTIDRLLSKVQKSVVIDTCLCRLPKQEFGELLFNSEKNIIVTNSVYEELIKLAITHDSSKDGIENAKQVIYEVINDTESAFCTIVDIPKESYVDNQLLNYCMENNYELYTHDYVLGLRAKARKINVTVYTSFNLKNIASFVPTASGKNIILNEDILGTVSLKDILSAATSMGASHFILTNSFIESLEVTRNKFANSELIKFLVKSLNEDYMLYLTSDEPSDIKQLANKYNAVIFTANVFNGIDYKSNFIPYKIVGFSETEKFVNKVRYIYENLSNTSSAQDISVDSSENDSTVSSIVENVENSDEMTSKKASDLYPTSIIIPYYRPKSHSLPIKELPDNEDIYVLDSNEKELSPNFKSGYSVFPGYTIIHIVKLSRASEKNLKLSVYTVLNTNTSNYGTTLFSSYYNKTDISSIPKEYQTFATRSAIKFKVS